ncbi:FAD-dependent monooxygenase [Streptomyces sp. NPDC053431]|uniref:FAD-dependent monooxygenase n=1 Tax=Streptomyces sp. NPDC053431 TaxID=3365703 RepID=UPI0037D5F30A
MTGLDAPVGIVGAGPIGLVAAMRLATLGVPCMVLEADPDLVKQGSKACLIQGDVLEVLDKFGCGQPIKDEGVTWTVAHTYVRNKVIRSAEYPHGPGFGPFVNISQYRIEQILLQAAEAHPDCEIRWGHEVTAVEQDEDAVTVRARTADGERTLRFGHLVAADGVRSTVRDLVGVAWTGYTHKDRFLITDIRAKLPLAKERHFHYDPSFNPGRQLVMHPQPDDIWRIDWQLPPDTDIDAERADGRFDQRVRAVIGDIPYEVDWVSTYRFHQRVVERLRVGRLLFAGDAAHALPPYGSRGMNSGIQDADNLAWKLALVHAGQGGEELLESYHTERYAAARENLRVTEATIRFMVPPSRMRRLARSTILALSHRLSGARDRVNSGRMAEPYVYADSPLVQSAADEPLLGAFARDGIVDADGRRTRLRQLLGDGFVALCFAPDTATAADLVAEVRAHAAEPSVRTVAVLPMTAPAGPLPSGVAVVRTADAELLAAYGAATGRWWLARPDGHLAARGRTGAEFTAALHRAVGSPAERPLVRGTR